MSDRCRMHDDLDCDQCDINKTPKASESVLSDLLCAKNGLIQIAARLVMCKALNELYEVCENQQTIKTEKLNHIVDRASDKLKNEAVYIRKMANKIGT